ncbi:MAG: prephenate dehydrogenase [Vicinamibacterales bacterium]
MSDERRLPMVQAAGAGAPPIFEKVAIIGLGLVGGSIALAARETWPAGLVIAVDNKNVLEQAIVKHAIDVAADEPYVIADADLVILAAPVRQNLRLLDRLGEHIDRAAVVTDVGSTKRAIVGAARRLPARFTFVGGHPLGGGSRGGFEAARSDLFQGRPWIFTPHGETGGEALDKLYAFVSGLGAVPKTMGAAEHDRVLAFLSHLPQLAASALMEVVGTGAADALPLAGRGLVDTTRLAGSPPGIWQDIAATNADEIRPALDALIARLTDLRDGLGRDDVIERLFTAAARYRSRLMDDR